MSEKRAVLFVNGELSHPAALQRMMRPDDFLVAADGGLRHLQTLGLTPHLLIGDLDSVSLEDVAAMTARKVQIQRFPPQKDDTDLELALQAVRHAGYRQIVLVAALGGRLDHTLGNLYLLTNPAFHDFQVCLEDGQTEVFVIRQTGTVRGSAGDVVSLLPVEAEASGVTTEGLAYPLRQETLWRHQGRGISNVMLGETAKITVEDGALFCVHSRQRSTVEKRRNE